MEEYRNIRYNDSEAYSRLRDNVFVRKRIQEGIYGDTINPEKQAPHMKSTVKPGGSYFNDDVDVQALFDKYAGTGSMELDKNGRRKNTEIITVEDFYGIAVSLNGSAKTNSFKIHHSKKRTHIVPYLRRPE
ncbi:polymorphic toxin type 50 domain-containing protein [Streptococcaceae bacterium ESL0729]|nr:polymorphic toxin type 50 domain-containing protein [Streptococcaceae bacterium ESL0729]